MPHWLAYGKPHEMDYSGEVLAWLVWVAWTVGWFLGGEGGGEGECDWLVGRWVGGCMLRPVRMRP